MNKHVLRYRLCLLQIIDAEHDPGVRGCIEKVDVHPGIPYATAYLAQRSGLVWNRYDKNVSFLLHIDAGLPEGGSRRDGVIHEDVGYSVALTRAAHPLDVDPCVS